MYGTVSVIFVGVMMKMHFCTVKSRMAKKQTK